jgi:hypothetical protein
MSTFTALISAQEKIGNEVQRIIRNFKKDPAERKTTTKYFDERIRQLKETWEEFDHNDYEIRSQGDMDLGHDYFSKDYYSNIKKIVDQHIELFKQEMEILQQSQSKNRGKAPEVCPKDTAPSDSTSCKTDRGASIIPIIRKQKAMAGHER